MIDRTPQTPLGMRSISLLRVGFALIGFTALICGYLGLAEHLESSQEFANDPWDLIYYDLQLFVLGSPPLDSGGQFPLTLQIARFAVPAVTIYALVEAGRLIFAAEARRLRTRMVRRHAIVCGDTMIAALLTRRMTTRNGR